jgi:hypothetical protein
VGAGRAAPGRHRPVLTTGNGAESPRSNGGRRDDWVSCPRSAIFPEQLGAHVAYAIDQLAGVAVSDITVRSTDMKFVY